MKRNTILPLGIALLVVFSVVTGCSRGPSEEELKLAALEDQLATLQQQYQVLQEARTELATATATLAEISALKERDLSEEQVAQLAELPTQIDALTSTRDEAFDPVQATLADFLNVALNEFPENPATVKGLDIYSDEAILIAEETVVKSGDYKKAITQLDAALSYYESLDLPPNPNLTAKLANLDEMRFITQERFDLVTKGMTKEEVNEVAGVAYYQNIQIDEKRGVETWLYRKRDGGGAAVYFKTKDNKVYNKNFEAITTKVVE